MAHHARDLVDQGGPVAAATDLRLENLDSPYRRTQGAGDDAEEEGEAEELGWEARWGRGETMSASLGNAGSRADDAGSRAEDTGSALRRPWSSPLADHVTRGQRHGKEKEGGEGSCCYGEALLGATAGRRRH